MDTPMYQTLEIEQRGAVANLWLNRPQVRNAMDETLIAELTQALVQLEASPDVRVIVLGGRGQAFCAGGDLNWMKRMAGYSAQQNRDDAMGLARMLQRLSRIGKPTIARVHGAAFAGGMGLAAACDMVVAEPAATFCLSEVRIGLIPATISPYVVQALGMQAAKRYMLTAERISAALAHRLGMVHELCEPGAIDTSVDQLVQALLTGGPDALAKTKALLALVNGHPIDDALIEQTADLIALVRASDEGKEGVASFLDKRSPAWLTSVA